MGIKNNITTEEFLEKCINKTIEEIYVTGWTEVKDGINFFEPMDFYYYVKFEDFFICIESNDSKGMQFYLHREIQCFFEEDLENDEPFTIMTVNKEDYSTEKIIGFELFYDEHDYLWALGTKLENTDQYYGIKNRYIFFNALNIDGIILGHKRDKDYYFGDNKRFRLVKYPSQSIRY